jgi:hypothetical protein
MEKIIGKKRETKKVVSINGVPPIAGLFHGKAHLWKTTIWFIWWYPQFSSWFI